MAGHQQAAGDGQPDVRSVPSDLGNQDGSSGGHGLPTVVAPKVRFSVEFPESYQTIGTTDNAEASSSRGPRGNGFGHPPGSRRDRGYSLRRMLFSHNFGSHDLRTQPIEMQTPISQVAKSSRSTKRDTTITIMESPSDEVESSGKGRIRLPMSKSEVYDAPSHQSLASRFSRLIETMQTLPDRLFKLKALPPSPEGRHVRVNATPAIPLIDVRTNKAHIDNLISSCKYTPWDFFPRQLVAQFSKLANFYFLCVSVMQMFPGISPTGRYTVILPLAIFVGISMAKEGYDDVRRHKLDKEDNKREIQVMETRQRDYAKSDKGETPYPETTSTTWRTEKWQNVRVGDVVLLERDDAAPADLILLHTKSITGSAYIETKSLDGETNLKKKDPVSDVHKSCTDLDTIASLRAEFVVEDPNLDLYKFDGRATVEGKTFPLTNNEVIYRGSILRNTSAIVGLVIYSGEECKIRMNANKSPRIKAPHLQGVVNKVVIFVASIVIFIAILLSCLYLLWKHNTEQHSFYLNGASYPLGFITAAFIILVNTMLPLSLYVSLEIVKIAQMYLMNDIDMYDSDSDIPMEPHTSTINEELGQVSYIFSDKTGTLTNNMMKFRKMSVAGTAWLHDVDLRIERVEDANRPKLLHKKRSGKGKSKARSRKSRQSQGTSSIAHDVSSQAAGGEEFKSADQNYHSLHCGNTDQLLDYLQYNPQSSYARKARFLILGLALCHTCMPEKDEDGNVSFQAASPDELALVNAAFDLGYMVTNRDANSITVKTYPMGIDEDPIYDVYEVLEVIEFSSARKRMSIVVRLPDGRVCLFVKGADTTLRHLLRLSDLAARNVSEIQRRASHRKSLEIQEMLRRRSTQLSNEPRKSRTSITIPGASPGVGRNSSISFGKGRTTRESIDLWLKDKENDNEVRVPRASNAYHTPRQSAQIASPGSFGVSDHRQSLARANSRRMSMMSANVDELIDDGVALSDTATFERCFQHIDDFATEGLRTLLFGYKILSDSEFQAWRQVYAEAQTSLVDRQEKVEAAGALIENNLELLGATAIEDKLQKGVPDAIDRFRRAGIKMWMLTGDKRETAINIGHSCRLIKDYSTVVILDHEHNDLFDLMTKTLADITGTRTAHTVMVIDGQTLSNIDADPSLKPIFTDLAILTDSVICCRASPSQKASLVRTIRLRVKDSVTLAIGDGANDIAMIQEAHLGIGIAGKEGLQAARASDYSIGQFRFLLKLLLVHGRWNYVRICKYTLGTFWKEMVFYLVQALYQRWNGYTGTSLYESWSLSMFNTLFTSLPVIFMGVFEKDLAASTLLAVPELYSIGRLNQGFNFRLYAYWATLGAVESCLIFFIMLGIYGDALFTKDQQLFAMGCLAFTTCVTVISFKLQFLELHNKSIAAVVAVGLSVGGIWLWNVLLSVVYKRDDPLYRVYHGLLGRFGTNPLWWLTLILCVMAVVLLEVVLKIFWVVVMPTDVDTFQAYEKDIEVRKRFEEAAADLLQQGWDRGTKKSSAEIKKEVEVMEEREREMEREQEEREAQVQEILRTRTREDEPQQGIRRRHSQPNDDGEGLEVVPKAADEKPRRSVDIGELFSKGFGKVKKGEHLK